MEWILDNWYMIIAFIAIGVGVGMSVNTWLEQSTSAQISSIKEWLLYAVTEAESALGEKTGQLKLHMVYDKAISKFTWLSFVPFETFSSWVDEALEDMREMLAENETINTIVKGK